MLAQYKSQSFLCISYLHSFGGFKGYMLEYCVFLKVPVDRL